MSRVEFTLSPKNSYFNIHLDYKYKLYKNLLDIITTEDEELAELIHQGGTEFNNKLYKSLCVSDLKFKFADKSKIKSGFVTAKGDLTFSISSRAGIVERLTSIIANQPNLIIAGNHFKFAGAEMIVPDFSEIQLYKTISPICLSVYDSVNKRPKFIRPDKDNFDLFKTQLQKNITRKVEAFNLAYSDIMLDIVPGFKPRVNRIKNNLIFSSDLIIRIATSKEIHKLIFDVGVGERNQLGFGMLESIFSKHF